MKAATKRKKLKKDLRKAAKDLRKKQKYPVPTITGKSKRLKEKRDSEAKKRREKFIKKGFKLDPLYDSPWGKKYATLIDDIHGRINYVMGSYVIGPKKYRFFKDKTESYVTWIGALETKGCVGPTGHFEYVRGLSYKSGNGLPILIEKSPELFVDLVSKRIVFPKMDTSYYLADAKGNPCDTPCIAVNDLLPLPIDDIEVYKKFVEEGLPDHLKREIIVHGRTKAIRAAHFQNCYNTALVMYVDALHITTILDKSSYAKITNNVLSIVRMYDWPYDISDRRNRDVDRVYKELGVLFVPGTANYDPHNTLGKTNQYLIPVITKFYNYDNVKDIVQALLNTKKEEEE